MYSFLDLFYESFENQALKHENNPDSSNAQSEH